MAYSLHHEYLDLAAGMHVKEFRNEHGHTHIAQLWVGLRSCPACGHAHPCDNVGEIDHKAMAAEINDAVNLSQADLLSYAQKHGLKVK